MHAAVAILLCNSLTPKLSLHAALRVHCCLPQLLPCSTPTLHAAPPVGRASSSLSWVATLLSPVAAAAQLPFDGLMELKVFNAVVNHGARPRLDPFEAFLVEPGLPEAERQAVARYSSLMQRCWAADVAARPRLQEVRCCCRRA